MCWNRQTSSAYLAHFQVLWVTKCLPGPHFLYLCHCRLESKGNKVGVLDEGNFTNQELIHRVRQGPAAKRRTSRRAPVRRERESTVKHGEVP